MPKRNVLGARTKAFESKIMFKLCILSILAVTVLLYSVPVTANNSLTGDMKTQIISPSTMTTAALKRFCEAEPQVVYCDQVTEKVKKKQRKKDESAFYTYNVLSANYY